MVLGRSRVRGCLFRRCLFMVLGRFRVRRCLFMVLGRSRVEAVPVNGAGPVPGETEAVPSPRNGDSGRVADLPGTAGGAGRA